MTPDGIIMLHQATKRGSCGSSLTHFINGQVVKWGVWNDAIPGYIVGNRMIIIEIVKYDFIYEKSIRGMGHFYWY